MGLFSNKHVSIINRSSPKKRKQHDFHRPIQTLKRVAEVSRLPAGI